MFAFSTLALSIPVGANIADRLGVAIPYAERQPVDVAIPYAERQPRLGVQIPYAERQQPLGVQIPYAEHHQGSSAHAVANADADGLNDVTPAKSPKEDAQKRLGWGKENQWSGPVFPDNDKTDVKPSKAPKEDAQNRLGYGYWHEYKW